MIEAVRKKDFAAFAELTMKDSNQFHATCLDTYPPIFYLNSVSQQVINLVHRYNRYYGETRVSNITLLFLRKYVKKYLYSSPLVLVFLLSSVNSFGQLCIYVTLKKIRVNTLLLNNNTTLTIKESKSNVNCDGFRYKFKIK